MAAHPRRWFAFRLRTLLVVVAALAIGFGLWIHHEQRIVQERRAMMERFDDNRHGGVVVVALGSDGVTPWERISPIRRALGDEPVEIIELPWGSTDADLQRARQLFPEASHVGGGVF
jgi:hypothetical protein